MEWVSLLNFATTAAMPMSLYINKHIKRNYNITNKMVGYKTDCKCKMADVLDYICA